ncbi:MAG: hypothetical protein BWY15_00451 [Firmicutes bacterium ADurb.Bin193]|nr:MAG: hypothetical protein BWY15_00451 [Firmicutes bacterium ADurb.Bin193]
MAKLLINLLVVLAVNTIVAFACGYFYATETNRQKHGKANKPY